MKSEEMVRNREHSPAPGPEVAPGLKPGTVVSLQICRKHRAPMEKLGGARALENFGLEGDRHAMPNGSRQVLLIEEETLNNLDVPIGAVKENITTRGIDLMRLAPGTQLRIRYAIFVLTKPCDPCTRMEEIRTGLQEELEGRRGMLARVVRGGEIRVGDEIKIVG